MIKKNKIVLIFSMLFSFNITCLFAQPVKNVDNFHFLVTCLQDSLQSVLQLTHLPVIEIAGNESFLDLELYMNHNSVINNIIILENLQVSFTYIPYRKAPLFKERWIRNCYVSGWIISNNQKKIINWKFEDRISENPFKLENPNWKWTLGRVQENEAFVLPSWTEPAIAIGVVMAIVYSIFYIRS